MPMVCTRLALTVPSNFFEQAGKWSSLTDYMQLHWSTTHQYFSLALTAWTVIASNSLYLQLTLFPGCLWWLSYNSLHLMHICYVKSCAPSDTVEASGGDQQERLKFS